MGGSRRGCSWMICWRDFRLEWAAEPARWPLGIGGASTVLLPELPLRPGRSAIGQGRQTDLGSPSHHRTALRCPKPGRKTAARSTASCAGYIGSRCGSMRSGACA